MSEFVTVAKVGAIPEGQGATFTLGDRLVAVFNRGGTYFAIDDLCPHMGASLAEGYVDENTVTCPWHAWRFCIQDGTWEDNPRVKVDCFEVKIEGENVLVREIEKKEESEGE